MNKILALVGGGDRDEVIFRTALAAADPLSAHLDFLHVHVSAGVAAQHDSKVQFAMGAGMLNALDHLEANAKTFSEVAADNVRQFCAASKIEMCPPPADRKNVTAGFREENDTTIESLILHACQSDLVVLGRRRQTQGLSPDTLEHLLRNCDRPVLLAATAAPQTLTGTVMVCWKKSDNVARAIAAAMPILTHAKRVVFASVAKRDDGGTEAARDLAQRLGSTSIATDVKVIPPGKAGIPGLLAAAAADCKADLVVMGAYGHSRLRQLVFGSCTDDLIGDIDRPILLMR